jgi:hypothetical protein
MTEIAGIEGTLKLASFDLFNGFSLCTFVPFMYYVLKRRNYTSLQKEDKKKKDLESQKLKEAEDIEKELITELDELNATKKILNPVYSTSLEELQIAKYLVEQTPNEIENEAEAKKSNIPSIKRKHKHHKHHINKKKEQKVAVEQIKEEQTTSNTNITPEGPEVQVEEKKQKIDLATLSMFGSKVLLFYFNISFPPFSSPG